MRKHRNRIFLLFLALALPMAILFASPATAGRTSSHTYAHVGSADLGAAGPERVDPASPPRASDHGQTSGTHDGSASEPDGSSDAEAAAGTETDSTAASAPNPAAGPDAGPNALTGLAGNGGQHELGRALTANEKRILGPGHWHSTPAGKTWYGAYLSLTGYNAYCVDAGMRTPRPTFFTKPSTREITSPRTAYLLSTHSGSKSTDVHAALSAVSKLDPKIPHRHKVPVKAPSKLGKRFAGTAKQYASLRAEAAKLAGPYTVNLKLGTPKQTAQGATVKVTVRLTSASGKTVPGYRVALASSAGKLAQKSLTTTTKASTTKLTIPRPKPTKKTTARLTASASGLPSTKVVLYKPNGNGSTRVQNIVTRARPVQVKAASRLSIVGPSRPKVTTVIGDSRLQPGGKVWDTFTVSGLAKKQRVTVEHTLWHIGDKPKQSAQKPAGAHRVGTALSKSVGNGSAKSPSLTLPEDLHGWFYWTERIAAAPGIAAWQSDHGIPNETGVLPWIPSITTKATLTPKHFTTRDTITVAGGKPGSRLDLTARVFHTKAKPARQAKPTGSMISQQRLRLTLDKNGAGSVTTRAVTVKTGWSSWVAELRAGDGWDQWTSDYGIPEETVHLFIPTIPAVPPATYTSPPPTAPSQTSPPAETTPPPQPSTTSVSPQSPEGQASAPPAGPAAPPDDQGTPQAGGGPAPNLPRTGAQTTTAVGIGLFLLGLGTIVTVLARSRRQ